MKKTRTTAKTNTRTTTPRPLERTARDIRLSAIMGVVTGDALGCPVQFEPREARVEEPVTGMIGYRTFNVPEGSWTDDSSLTLALLTSINEKKTIDLEDIMDRFADWLENGAYTPYGYSYDIGRGTMNAIEAYIETRDVTTCGGTSPDNNGNGSLMRIMPACLFALENNLSDDDATAVIHAVSGLTHNHLRAKIACGLYYFCARELLSNETRLATCLKRGLKAGFQYYEKDPSNLEELQAYDRLRDLTAFAKLDADAINSSGYVVDTLEAAIWSLLTTDSFKDCELKAVNLGNDTDSVAAVAGGLAGLYYTYEAIPEEWLAVIKKRDWIESLCEVPAPDIDVDLIQDTINDILPGLNMYVRDVDLPPALAKKYEPGMIIAERAYTDASSRVMGMVTSHRYAILSNHMTDLGPYEEGTNWGLFVARRNAHFKVLDVYEYRGRTQILLLHLPDDSRWKLFKNLKINLEDQMIEDCRKRFENKSVQEPIPELATKDWLKRCSFPLGMTEQGELFDVDIPLVSELHSVKDAGFREFYHRFVYLDCRDVLEGLYGSFLKDDDTGVLAYGYIDEEAGLSFQVAKLASLKDYDIELRDSLEDAMMIIRIGSLETAAYIDIAQTDIDTRQFADFEQAIRGAYDPKDSVKEQLRALTFLDLSRHPEYPDDIAVYLTREGLEPECVWVRSNYLTENEIRGDLLNEPMADFGVHIGESVQIIPHELPTGQLVFVSPQNDQG